MVGKLYAGHEGAQVYDTLRQLWAAHVKEHSAARVRLYEAITYLKLAHIIVCITRPHSWHQSVATLLGKAQKIV